MSMLQEFRDGRYSSKRTERSWRILWPVFLIGQLWWLIETAYFGWNISPVSDSEMICDGIVLIITALSIRTR